MPAAEQFATVINACCATAGVVGLAILFFRVGRRAVNAI